MRKRFLYLRLAISNLWKNRQTYLSFFLSTMCTVFVFYTFSMIALNEGLRKMPGAQGMQIMMVLGAFVVAIFAFIFLFYANSFLIKRRKKELGLYGILGLEKKHIARILFHETVALLIISLFVGICLGIALSKLMFLLIQTLMHVPTPIVFSITEWPIILTCGLFAAVFSLLLIYNRFQVHLSSPVNLLKGQQKGEKEPKTRWLLAIIGAAAMVAGYIMANSIKNPAAALSVFFVAVLLVILGTYSLFTAGSVALLKILRRNKGYYYKPRNFISVSGMIYRMKQNAAGLAGICILSTMAIITIGTTASLYMGMESMLKDQNPTDQRLSYTENAIDDGYAEQTITQRAKAYGIEITDLITGIYSQLSVYREGNTLQNVRMNDMNTSARYENVWSLYIFTVDEYNRITGSAETLGEAETLLFQSRDVPDVQDIIAGSTVLTVKKNLSAFPLAKKGNKSPEPPMFLVVNDRDAAEGVIKNVRGQDTTVTFYRGFWWNSSGDEETLFDYSQDVKNTFDQQKQSTSFSSVNLIRREWYAMYGGFLFLGVFLGLLFLMATTLIIYFKQVSEGYMDHDRFIILQKVGMGREEVKATVRKQILMVFILPIVAAVIHTWGALHMMTAMLNLLGLGDRLLITASIFTTAGVFALLYCFVYSATARTYYSMVRMEQ